MAASAGISAPLAISIQSNGHIHVLAHQAPVSEVIERLKHTMGDELEIHDSVPNTQTLSADCSSPDLVELIPCVFGHGTNYILQTSRHAGLLRSTRVWILPRGAMSSTALPKYAIVPSPVTTVERDTPVSTHADKRALGERGWSSSALHVSTPTGDSPSSKAQAQQQLSSQDPTLEPLTDADVDQLVAMSRADDAEQRAQALTRLAAGGPGNHGAVRQALQAGLTDNDAAVRAQAVFGVAQRDGDAAFPVLQRAIVDYDASVRLVAVDSAPRNSLGHALLETALTDTDATVRSLAAAKVQEWGQRP